MTAALLQRRSVWAGVALAALAAGVGFGVLRRGDGDDALAALWALRLPKPDGGELAMADLRGRPLVVNFWATWCPPCVRELPTLDRFARQRAGEGWQVVALAVDDAQAVRNFIQRLGIGLTVAVSGFQGTELLRQLGNSQGGLPFTILVGRAGHLLQRKIGEITAADLERWHALA